MSRFKRFLKGLAVLLAFLGLLVIGVLGYNGYLMYSRMEAAREAAARFCAGLTPGTAIEPVLARAAADHIRVSEMANGAGYEFQFPALIQSSACRAQVETGKVTRLHVISFADD